MKTVRRSPSCTASMAATRPLIVAEPMFRAPRPEIVSESILTTGAAAGACARAEPRVAIPNREAAIVALTRMQSSLGGRGRSRRRMEEGVVEGDVRLDLVEHDLLPVGASLDPLLERVGVVDPGDFFVVAERGLRLALGAADHALLLDLDRNEVLGVDVVVLDVAVLQRHLELEGIGAFDGLGADELDGVALLLRVDERAVEVRVLEDLLHLFLAEGLDILLALKGVDLPARFAVVRRDS